MGCEPMLETVFCLTERGVEVNCPPPNLEMHPDRGVGDSQRHPIRLPNLLSPNCNVEVCI
jgi:hypothetical protein